MLFNKIKDIKSRKLFNKVEKLRKIQKFIFITFLSNPLIRNKKKAPFLIFSLNNILKKSSKSKVKIVRRCAINNRARGVFRPYNISRILLRELMQFGVVPGFSKAVW